MAPRMIPARLSPVVGLRANGSPQAALLAVLLALLLITPVEAHANLVRSVPAAGATLEAAPADLVLEFSEELDPGFTRVQLFNGKSQLVETSPFVIDAADPRILRLPLPALPKDSYTAIWRVRSAVDGHVTEGSLPFGVGVAIAATALIPPPGTPDPATELPPPLNAAARWLNLLVAMVAFGGLPFMLFVWRPVLHTLAATAQGTGIEQLQHTDQVVTRTVQRLMVAGCALFVLTNLLFLLTQAATAAGVPLASAIGAPVFQLLQGRSGAIWLARLVLTLAVAVLTWRRPIRRGEAWLWWIALLPGGAVALTFSLNAHAAAGQQGVAIAVILDWLHTVAAIAWLGGLIPLAIAITIARRTSERTLSLRQLIPRFSRLALVCVAVLALSGIYSYIRHVNSLDLLAATTYGRALAIKIGLFILLVLLGAVNMLILSPRLRAQGNHLARAFGRTVRLELIAGALVLLAVGVMTSVAPGKSAWEAHEQQGLVQDVMVDGVQLTLRVAPAQIGDNEFAVDVTDSRPAAQTAPAKVLLRFGMVGMEMGTLQTETQTADTRRYTARGNFVSMGGRWQVEVILRRAGFDDVRHTFEMDIVRSFAST